MQQPALQSKNWFAASAAAVLPLQKPKVGPIVADVSSQHQSSVSNTLACAILYIIPKREQIVHPTDRSRTSTSWHVSGNVLIYVIKCMRHHVTAPVARPHASVDLDQKCGAFGIEAPVACTSLSTQNT